MTDVPKEFWAMLAANETLAALVKSRIHRNTVPQGASLPYLWFAQGGAAGDDTLDREAGADSMLTVISVECIGKDLDSAEAVAACLKAYDGHRGALGEVRTAGMFVEDAADDYQPKNDFSDDGRHIVSLRVEIYR